MSSLNPYYIRVIEIIEIMGVGGKQQKEQDGIFVPCG